MSLDLTLSLREEGDKWQHRGDTREDNYSIEDVHSPYHDSLVSFDIDALLEELEHSTFQESDEYSKAASPPLYQHSRKESNLAETSKVPSIPDDTNPFPVSFHFLKCLKYLSAFLKINCISNKIMLKGESHIQERKKTFSLKIKKIFLNDKDGCFWKEKEH